MEDNDGKFTMITEASFGDWKFENYTTGRVIKLSLNDPDNLDSMDVWMDYGQFRQLREFDKEFGGMSSYG